MRLHVGVFIPLIIAPLFAFSCAQQINPDQQLINDVDAAKLRITQLETVLEESIRNVDSKTIYLKKREEMIQDAESQIRDLQSDLSSIKSGLPSGHERISELEEEVKLLWAALRKRNFNLHILKEKAREAEDRVKVAALAVEEMSDYVTEQWIQIQHLEQMREFNAQRHSRTNSCTFLKEWKLLMESYLSQTMLQLKGFWAAVTKYHHQLQGFIKHEMERNEITAALVNKEVVFFVASALITFPVFGAWMLLSS